MREQPLYISLKEKIKKEILSGIFKDGDLLPSENELMEVHNLSRDTVRKAMDGLIRENYITRHHGKGSIVNRKKVNLSLLSVKGFSQLVGETQQKVVTQMISPPMAMEWEEDFPYPLSESERDAGCIYVKRLRFVEDDPVMIENTYLPNNDLPGFCEEPFVNGSLFETLNRRYQIEMTNLEQNLKAVTADKEAARLLKVEEGDPLIRIYMKFFTNMPNFNLYSTLLCNTDKYTVGNML